MNVPPGCCVLRPQHGVPLADTCRHCAAAAPCHFRGGKGFFDGLQCLRPASRSNALPKRGLGGEGANVPGC